MCQEQQLNPTPTFAVSAPSDRPSLQWDGAPSEVQNRGPAFHARTYLIARVMRRLRPAHLLDIGCGRGYVTEIAARYAARITATDLAPDAVEETAGRLAWHPNASARVENALTLEWPSRGERVDTILLSEVLEHLEDDRGTLSACASLLSPGGHLVLTVPANPRLWTSWDDLAGHLRRYTRTELVSKLTDAGFRVESVTNWGFPIMGWLAIRGAKLRGTRVAEQASGGEVPALLGRIMPLASVPFRLLACIEPWFSGLDRGAGYVVVASVRQS
jgi:SAM-dependent methyltransferase